MPRYTKGQIQVGESLAVIIVFIILVFFGLAWFASTSTVTTDLQQNQNDRLSRLEKTKEIMNLPEIRCSKSGGRVENTCIDKYRVEALYSLINSDPEVRRRYAEQFAGYEARVHFVYPDEYIALGIPIFDLEPSEDRPIGKSVVPVVVYDPGTGRHVFSMLVLTQYGGSS